MLEDVINAAVGLTLGLVTGYFFERRATAAVRRENCNLRGELRTLRESIYSVGGQRPATAKSNESQSLATDVRTWLKESQDAEGRVLSARATAEFVARGWAGGEIEEAIAELIRSGDALRDGKWVRVP